MEKLSSYNLFNYLLPGVVFAHVADRITHYTFVLKDVVPAIFIYYFLGLIVSRIGSLVIEPLMKKLKLIQFSPYSEYLAVSKKDSQLEILSEVNNSYRTFSSLMVSLICLKIYESFENLSPFLQKNNYIISTLSVLVLFVFAYQKQTKYISKRIKANLQNVHNG